VRRSRKLSSVSIGELNPQLSWLGWPCDIGRQSNKASGEEPVDVLLLEKIVDVQACSPAFSFQREANIGQVIGGLNVEVVERPVGLVAMFIVNAADEIQRVVDSLRVLQ